MIRRMLLLSVFFAGCAEESIAPDMPPRNQPPVVSGLIPDQRLTGPGAATMIDVSVHFSDPDGDALTYTAATSDTAVATVSMAGNAATLTGGSVGGSGRVTVTARDSVGAEASASFGVVVNRTPVASDSIPAQVLVDEAPPLEMDVSGYFGDPDGDALTFAASSSDISVVTVTFAGTLAILSAQAIGEAEVTLAARDPDGLEATVDFSVAVVENPDRKALVAFYDASGEPKWLTNWLTDAPLGEWHGVTVDEGGRVTKLDLFHPRSTGGYIRGGRCDSCLLPPELGNLTELEYLDLTNYGLVGPIPPELGNLTKLRHLALGDLSAGANNLTGEIPAELGNLRELRILFLDGNNLVGEIPPELGRLEHLEWLLLGGNDLAGEIPPELGNLTELEELWLSGNELVGTVPDELLGASPWFFFRNNASLCAPGTSAFVPWIKRMRTPREFWIPGYDISPWGSGGSLSVGPYCNQGDRGALNRIYESTAGEGWTDSKGWGETPALEEWYGVRTDSLGRVTALDLTRNGLTGSLPRGLDSLTALTRLRISDNALIGRLPLAMAQLDLEELDYSRTGLCAPSDQSFRAWLAGIPSHRGTGDLCAPLSDREILVVLHEATHGLDWGRRDNWLTEAPLEEWYGVTVNGDGRVSGLNLSGNRLWGAIPEELGKLSDLETLDLSANRNLGGPLPMELAALGRLRMLRTHDSDLCAPIDPAFQAWVKTIGDRWIEPCRVTAYLIQAVQSHHKNPVPLVAGRRALLRAFVTRTGTQATIPPVRARFYHGGREVHVEDIPGRPGELIPFSPDESDIAKSSNAEIPGNVIQPGLEMMIEVDPLGTLDPSVGVVKRIPEVGRLPVDVRVLPPLRLTLIPLVFSDTQSSYAQTLVSLVNSMASNPQNNAKLWQARTLLPVGEMDVTVHEVVAVTEATGRNVHSGGNFLSAVQVVRRLQGGTGHWMGVTGDGYGGLAEVGGWVSSSGLRTVAHELGHNMSLNHAPYPTREPSGGGCDYADNADPNYPYRNGSIGREGSVWGWDWSRRQLVPFNFPDVMSYCRNVWVSDYHFTKALQHRKHRSGGSGLSVAPIDPTRSLLLWGGADSIGAPYLEPAFVVDAPPGPPESEGPWTLEGRDDHGRMLFSLPFAMPEIADAGEGAGSFAYTLPVRPGWESLASVTLSGPGGTATLDGSTDRPVSIYRDREGRVRAILRGDPVQADGAHGTLADVPLDVVMSRGIPSPVAWRR